MGAESENDRRKYPRELAARAMKWSVVPQDFCWDVCTGGDPSPATVRSWRVHQSRTTDGPRDLLGQGRTSSFGGWGGGVKIPLKMG